MKHFRFFLAPVAAIALLGASDLFGFSPDVSAALTRQFGEAQLANVVLARAKASEADPASWSVYSRDPYRPGEIVRAIVTNNGTAWSAAPAGTGDLLKRTPTKNLDLKRVKFDSKAARFAATQAAGLAKSGFAKVEYQLAANEVTGSPEWGLALQDAAGYEVGFCVVSAETGAVVSQDWTPKNDPAVSASTPKPTDGEVAAKKVKQKARKAWDWTENAGRETKSFFKELFKRGN